MRKFLLILLLASLHIFAYGQSPQAEAIEGKDAPSDFYWQEPQKDQLAFRLLASDGKEKTFYIRHGEFFAPVKANASQSISSIYTSPSKSEIVFYARAVDKDKILFKPIFTVKAEGAKDLFLLVKGSDTTGYACEKINISFDEVKLGTIMLVNLVHQTIGVALGKDKAKLGYLESIKLSFSGEPEIKDIPVKLFSLRGGVKLAYARTLSFCTDERMIVFVFRLPNPDNLNDKTLPAMVFMYGKKR